VIWRRIGLVGLAAVLVVLAYGDLAAAQTVIYVPDDVETIQEAIDEAQAAVGQSFLILVREGLYPERLTIHADTQIVVRGIGTGGGRPDVTVAPLIGGPVVTIDGSGSGVTLDTLNILGGTTGIQIGNLLGGDAAAPTIRNCIIRQNDVGIECYPDTLPRIVNCMVVNNTTDGIFVHGGSLPQLINDTITANNQYEIQLLGGAGGTIVNTIAWHLGANDVVGNTTELSVSFSDIGRSGFAGLNNNINADPLFTADFKLPAWDAGVTESPCIDTGTASGAPATDFEGDPRPYDGDGDGGFEYDIGADEYSTGVPGAPPTAYATPDPTSYQPPGGVLFFVTGDDVTNAYARRDGVPIQIGADMLVDGSGSGSYIYTNTTAIDPETWDGAWDGAWEIWVNTPLTGPTRAGDFLIDTTPPVFLNSAPPSPFRILENSNDTITVTQLIVGAAWQGHWGDQGLPNPPAIAAEEVPNDGSNFFFNTGARFPNGDVAGTPLAEFDNVLEYLRINFVVEANDPGAEPSGFGEFWAPSGLPIIRDESSGDHYGPLDLTDPRFVLGPGSSIAWVLNFRPIAEGVYRIGIVAEDRAGNASLPVDLTVYWDKTPPRSRITSGPRPNETTLMASFTFELQEPRRLRHLFSRVLQVDFNPDPDVDAWVAYPPGFGPFLETQIESYGPSQLFVGGHFRFTVLGIDDYGNIETAMGAKRSWTIGSPVPDTIITSGPPRVMTPYTIDKDGERTRNPAIFRFRARTDDPDVYFRYMLTPRDGQYQPAPGQGEWSQSTTQPFATFNDDTKPQLARLGRAVSYKFQVQGWKDYNANTRPDSGEYDPTPATYTWTVVPGASPGDPRLPVGGTPPPEVLDAYGVDVYIDTPGEQPIKYQREEAE